MRLSSTLLLLLLHPVFISLIKSVFRKLASGDKSFACITHKINQLKAVIPSTINNGIFGNAQCLFPCVITVFCVASIHNAFD